MIGVFSVPEDPAEKEAWAERMARIQYAMWVDDGATCGVCGKAYASVDDFLERNPRVGPLGTRDGMPDFVDDDCYRVTIA